MSVVGCAIGRCSGGGGGRGSTAEHWELGGLILGLTVVGCSTVRSGSGVSGGEQRQGQGTLMGLGWSVMLKGSASQCVEVAGKRNKLDPRQDRFYRCSLYVASCQDS